MRLNALNLPCSLFLSMNRRFEGINKIAIEKSSTTNIRTCCIHAFLFCFGLKADRYRERHPLYYIILTVIFPREQEQGWISESATAQRTQYFEELPNGIRTHHSNESDYGGTRTSHGERGKCIQA